MKDSNAFSSAEPCASQVCRSWSGAVMVGLLALLGVGCGATRPLARTSADRSQPDPVPPPSASADEVPGQHRAHPDGASGWGVPRVTLVDSAELTSHVTASYLERGSLRFEVREDLGGVGPLEQSVVESLSFDPRGVSGLDSHRFLVWGEARGGVWTVELWRVVPETGAPVLTRKSSRGVPVGSSISTPPVELRIVGGTYLPPDQRLLPNVEREVLLLATDLVEVQAACVDPDDRFVLWVLHHDDGTRSLERLELQGLARTQLVTDTDVPFLRDTHSLRALRDGVELRQYYAETGGEAPQGSDYGVVLHDADNDGVIEGLDALDQQAFQSLPAYWSPVEDFVRY